ncbi:MAG: Protoheme IX farnesyltransferase, mitochondrial [Phylliscum demangeonii]|nr:MAG: Protoheme IX farnesyltransferase, mitochondrial [Phylliscum demangeonii]
MIVCPLRGSFSRQAALPYLQRQQQQQQQRQRLSTSLQRPAASSAALPEAGFTRKSRSPPRAPLLYFESNAGSRFSKTTGSQHPTLPKHTHAHPLPAPAPAAVGSLETTSIPSEHHLPLDASSQLSVLSARLPPRSLRRQASTYLSLAKPRLSFLIVLTTAAAYSLYPVPALLVPATTASPSLSALTFLLLTSGTALSCASANTLNMLLEPAHDAKMSRTRNRPLVRRLVTPRAALAFAVWTAAAGLGLLGFGVNATVAGLSALNIVLYAGVYTPMKRFSVLNTWVGAVVGGIPPLMGWAAAAGQTATGTGAWHELLFGPGSAGGWILAGLLYAWQFPHFNALSCTIRDEYRAAGYRMLAWTNPAANARVALRYALLVFPLCFALYAAGVTDGAFLVTSSVVNGWLVREAYRFWRHQGARGTARGLFWASVWHLPVILVLAMAHKKGLWDGLWPSWMPEDGRATEAVDGEEGEEGEDGEEEEEEEEEGEEEKEEKHGEEQALQGSGLARTGQQAAPVVAIAAG